MSKEALLKNMLLRSSAEGAAKSSRVISCVEVSSSPIAEKELSGVIAVEAD